MPTHRPVGANALAKRPRNLWRRPYGSFRLGQKRPSDLNLDEQRLTLYLPAFVLDWAEQQASQEGVSTVQIYCAGLLREAIEDRRSREQVAEAEARTGHSRDSATSPRTPNIWPSGALGHSPRADPGDPPDRG